MNQLVTEVCFFDELTDEEKAQFPNHKESDCYSYFRVVHNAHILHTYSNCMEPEDVTFHRDLSWVGKCIEEAYLLGRKDVQKDSAYLLN